MIRPVTQHGSCRYIGTAREPVPPVQRQRSRAPASLARLARPHAKGRSALHSRRGACAFARHTQPRSAPRSGTARTRRSPLPPERAKARCFAATEGSGFAKRCLRTCDRRVQLYTPRAQTRRTRTAAAAAAAAGAAAEVYTHTRTHARTPTRKHARTHFDVLHGAGHAQQVKCLEDEADRREARSSTTCARRRMLHSVAWHVRMLHTGGSWTATARGPLATRSASGMTQ